ncbi:efflux RND transporter periplasmic adaptor subunit [Candidatus Accumulibacter sp. ACC007]|uniref:efflux RND transporter periplasmic adaptor subunit n=1 Tax=Candidatus Accumulibacter sp. ACC007 TaxID=2823333 RepID=UPI0025C350E6|nr:efflux RND transporter periplasmic adaptor subunit [Candidatus Accumulibacter sp. ACC007]
MKIEVGVVLPRVLGGLAISLAAVAVGSGEVLAAPPLGCLIEPEQVAEVGSPVIGVIEAIRVERGDRVSKGQVLALLRGDVERAAVGVAGTRARAEADEQAARSNVAFARQKLERTQGLLEKKFISEQALDQVRTEYEVAEQRLVQAREQKRVAQRELGLAEAQLAQRSIRSPFDGVVAERYLSVGERVEEKPLFRVAKVDPLRVQVVVPAALYGKIESGAFASVQPQLPETAAVQAQVTLVDQLIDAPSNTFRVLLTLPNPDLRLPAGLRCQADFGLDLPVLAGKQGVTPSSPARPIRPTSFGSEESKSGAPGRALARSY